LSWRVEPYRSAGRLSHGDPFGQHCGGGRKPRRDPIKAAGKGDAKMAKAFAAKNRPQCNPAALGTAVAAR